MAIKKNVPRHKLQFAILAVDVVCFRIYGDKIEVLLGSVNVPPYFIGMQGVIGGLVAPEETADQAVVRHLRDKAGIRNIYKEQLYTFSRISRDPRGRVVSVAYLALASDDPRNTKQASVATSWHPVRELSKLAYDHNEIVIAALERLKARIGYTNIAQHLLPREFTLTELQRVYEAVLEKELDKRNFRKKVLGIDLVKRVGKKKFLETKKPAALYKFSKPEMEIVEIL